MAKKLRKLEIEADGMIILGIHKIPPPPSPIPAEESSKYLKQWVEKFNRPVREVIAEIRKKLRDIVMPHLEGPIPEEIFHNKKNGKPAADALRGTFYGLDLGSGPEIYRANEYMLLHSNGKETRRRSVAAFEKLDQREQVSALMAIDAVEELNELRVAMLHLDTDGSLDFLFKTAFRCGWMYKQMQVRDFEPDAITAKKRRKASAKGGKATTIWSPRLQKLAGSIFAEFKRPGLKNEDAYRRTAAKLLKDHGESVSVSTLKRRLGKPVNA